MWLCMLPLKKAMFRNDIFPKATHKHNAIVSECDDSMVEFEVTDEYDTKGDDAIVERSFVL